MLFKALTVSAFLSMAAASDSACAPAYQQCGGINWSGATCCETGFSCTVQNDYYSQCLEDANNSGCQPFYQQCGGKDFTGTTCCQTGSTCQVVNEYYHQCLPGSGHSHADSAPASTQAVDSGSQETVPQSSAAAAAPQTSAAAAVPKTSAAAAAPETSAAAETSAAPVPVESPKASSSAVDSAAAAPAAEPAAKDAAGWQSAGVDSKRQNRPQSISGPPAEKEGTLGYVKYVTDKVQDAELRGTLAAFGELTYFDINRQKVCLAISPDPLDSMC